ncbi:MAG TPA: hypothetical protein P5287_05470 [bacterium]|nr:hypothetical protein [bacterium]
MVLIAKLVGVWIVMLGIVFLLRTDFYRRMVKFWMEGRRLYMAGVVRIVLGALFLLAASQCRHPGMMIAFGVLVLAGGVSIYVMGLERTRKMLSWCDAQNDIFFRFTAAAVIAVGMLLLYSI